MKAQDKFKAYIWLVNTIHRAKRITLAEINDRWLNTDMSEGMDIPRSTFARHKIAIEDMFGIIIGCDKQNGYTYFIENDYVLGEDTVQNWLLSTLSVNNIISESLSLQSRILLQPVPSEGDYLKMVIEAMKKGLRIAVAYRKYGTDKPNDLDFEPYCIKLFKQRWYILGHFHRDATPEKPESDYFGIFSLDRVLDMKLTDIKFQVDPDFDAQTYFDECYGVLVNDDTQPEHIKIRAYGYERFYMRDLPVHKSQREIGRGENFSDFELFIRPTPDFSAHLLSRGSMVKVLSPQWLADEIRNLHLEAAQQYQLELKEELIFSQGENLQV